MKRNLNKIDRAVRLLIGLPTSVSYTYFLHEYPKTSYALLAASLVLIVTGAVGYSPFYRLQRFRRRKRILIRPESPADIPSIREINEKAFNQKNEADLVDALRAAEKAICSLVAVVDEKVTGHILFSPVTLEGSEPGARGAGLAPVAVLPDHQREGIGSALIQEGLKICRERGLGWVVVLGDPAYYPRFGFALASRFGLRCEYNAPPEAFMALELEAGALQGAGGFVRYAPEFRP